MAAGAALCSRAAADRLPSGAIWPPGATCVLISARCRFIISVFAAGAIIAVGHPAPEGSSVGPLNQNLYAGIQHFQGDRLIHGACGLQVRVPRTKNVERLDIGVMGDKDHINVGATSRARYAAWRAGPDWLVVLGTA
jgi:hypothetical protein